MRPVGDPHPENRLALSRPLSAEQRWRISVAADLNTATPGGATETLPHDDRRTTANAHCRPARLFGQSPAGVEMQLGYVELGLQTCPLPEGDVWMVLPAEQS